MARISVVVPCCNEASVIRQTHARLLAVLARLAPMEPELIYVDDGSTDGTRRILRELCAGAACVRVIVLSRNFGHQMALTAGLESATGDAVVVIDADLQDPPEVMLEMVARWRAGADVVYGVRTARLGEPPLKLWAARLFYRILRALSSVQTPLDVGDFRLMDRRVVQALLQMPERDRFLRRMVSWVGYSQTAVPYRRDPRAAGRSKYPPLKMLRLAADGILSFSLVPLRLATWMGVATLAISFAGMIYALVLRLATDDWVRGWASTFIAITFIGGVQLLTLGIIGEYVGRIYGEVKRRPLYFVEERLGFERTGPRAAPVEPAGAHRKLDGAD
jgi:glycosyltransferase involved in cell wall biosynthesis